MYTPVLAKHVPVIVGPQPQPRSADVNDVKDEYPAPAAVERVVLDGRYFYFKVGQGLLVGWLKDRREAVFAGHRFYDFHASGARIDLFAGSNHSRSL